MQKKRVLFLTSITVLKYLSGCGSDPGFNEDTDFVVDEGSAQFVNLMADSPNLTILHGLTRSSVQFPFTSPVELRAADDYDWKIIYFNTVEEFDSDNEIIVAEGEDQVVQKDALSSFLIMGSLNEPNIQIVNHEGKLPSDRPDGEAMLWFASNSSNFDMVSIFLSALNEDLSSLTPLATLNRGTFSDLIAVASGTERQLRITETASGKLIFDSGSIEIPDKSNELFAIVDDFGPNQEEHVNVIRTLSASRSIIPDINQPAFARAGNFSDFEQVSVVLGDTGFGEINFQDVSDYREIMSGEINLDINDNEASLEESSQTGVKGNFQSLFVFSDKSDLDKPATRSLSTLDDFRPVIDRALFKFVNGSDQTLDLYAVEPGDDIKDQNPLLNDFGFGGSGTTEVLARPADLIVANEDSSETLTLLSLDFIAGKSYTVIYDSSGNLILQLGQ